MFFFFFFELYLAKYLQRGRGRARSTWCLTNREFPSMTMASVQWPLGKIQILKLVFLDCIPGKITYIAFQYHLQWTTYIFKGCEQFDKFFLHWWTYKRKKTWLTYFPISCFKLPPSSTTFGMIFNFSAIPAAFSTSRQPNTTDSIFWPNAHITYRSDQISGVQQSQPCIGPNFYFKKSRCFWCSGPKSQDASDQSANHEDFQGSKDQTPQGPRAGIMGNKSGKVENYVLFSFK